jgi:hypothetical protein
MLNRFTLTYLAMLFLFFYFFFTWVASMINDKHFELTLENTENPPSFANNLNKLS